MNSPFNAQHESARHQHAGGIRIHNATPDTLSRIINMLDHIGLSSQIRLEHTPDDIRISLSAEMFSQWTPRHDTLLLTSKATLSPFSNQDDLHREIWLAMLAAPVWLNFPDADELESNLRMRANIVVAANQTQLAFDTEAIERPKDCWTYHEDTGFTVIPGHQLIEALVKVTQPGASGNRYAFSCYRATEYVILLAVARELSRVNPALYARLQQQWQTKAIMSGKFHDVFLHELGSLTDPLPDHYYIPGDRVWFRNPERLSSDVPGYEGSWVFYLGSGLFSNFWQPGRPFTLTAKCVEIHHWRNGVYIDANGRPAMDESKVEMLTRQTLADPEATAGVLSTMHRLRAPAGSDVEGGCLDASREYPRFVHPHNNAIDW